MAIIRNISSKNEISSPDTNRDDSTSGKCSQMENEDLPLFNDVH